MKKITQPFILFLLFSSVCFSSFSQNVVLMTCENNTFNQLSFNVFANGTGQSNADITLVNNPLVTGANTSAKVAAFLRRTDATALPFAGAFSGIAAGSLDFTTNKFIHVKVLKNKVSPVKFKIEGGPSGDIELASTLPYATAGVWQDMVFNFSAASGNYPTLVFFPDFQDPLINSGNITVYFDEIYLSNSATPSGTLSTNDNFKNTSVKIYPTLISNLLTIENLEKISNVTIYNIQGQHVFKSDNLESGINQFDISNLSPGVYLAIIALQDGSKISQKIIKK